MTDAYRWASAIVRLSRLRMHCRVHLSQEGLEFYFRSHPTCRCCSVPLCRERWLGVVAHGYEYELAWLLISERWEAGVPLPPQRD